MRFAGRLCLAAWVCVIGYATTPEIEVSLAHGTTAEAETRQQLQKLLKEYDLSDWVWTRKIVIDKDAIPHSHPVLTLHTRHLKEDLLLRGDRRVQNSISAPAGGRP